MKWYHNGVTDLIMSVTLISVSHDTVVSNKHEERTRHYYVIFQHKTRERPSEVGRACEDGGLVVVAWVVALA